MPRVLTVIIILLWSGISLSQNLTVYKSDRSVDETTLALVDVIKDSDLMFFETVSHDSIARARNVKLKPTRSILFEDPDLTTSLLMCQQTVAHDLPLEIIVWEENNDVYIGFIDPRLMHKRFMIEGCDDTLDKLSRLMIRVTMDALRQL